MKEKSHVRESVCAIFDILNTQNEDLLHFYKRKFVYFQIFF